MPPDEQRAILAQAPIPLFRVDAAGACVWVNHAWVELTGRTADVARRDGFCAVLHPDERDAIEAQWERYVEHGGRLDAETRIATPGGEIRHVHLRVQPLALDGTIGEHGHVGSLLDISAEHAREERLRVSEERYELAVAGSADGLWDWDLVADRVHFSPRFRELLGYGPDEPFPSRISSWTDRLHDRDRVRILTALDDHLRLRRPFDMDARLHTRGGGYRWFHARGQATWDASGRATRMAGSISDVNERVRALEELKRSRAELSAAMAKVEASERAKSQFLANMSHEIRTPLNGVVGMSELLLATDLDEDQRSYAETVTTCAEALLSLINDILDFSKIEAGMLECEAIPFDLSLSVDEVLQILEHDAKRRGLTLDAEIDSTVPTVRVGDPSRVRQVLINLVGNALKFTREGGVTIAVRSAGEGGVRVEVRDTGIGIPEERRHRLFRSFSQVDASTTREFGGTGLGLAISKKLVELFGGTIGVDSVEGEGSTFWFEAPLPEADTPGAGAPTRKADEAAAPRPARVLLAEDNAVNRTVVLKLLERDVESIVVATNGAEAVARVEDEPFDLVLMDCQMPEMDGYEATRVLRRRGVTVPIVALTASAMEEDRRRALAAGMDDHVTKPVSRAALRATLARWLPAGDD